MSSSQDTQKNLPVRYRGVRLDPGDLSTHFLFFFTAEGRYSRIHIWLASWPKEMNNVDKLSLGVGECISLIEGKKEFNACLVGRGTQETVIKQQQRLAKKLENSHFSLSSISFLNKTMSPVAATQQQEPSSSKRSRSPDKTPLQDERPRKVYPMLVKYFPRKRNMKKTTINQGTMWPQRP